MIGHRTASALRLVLALLTGLVAAPLHAETVLIRSGEHPGFTRLVLQPDAAHEWQLGRTATGYELRMKGDGISFVTDNIFHKISRQRISAVEPLARSGALALTSRCDCFAKATQLPDGKVVIDIADGTPRANSLFEQPLDAGDKIAEPRPSLPHPGQTREMLPPHSSGATLSFRLTANDEASLPIYWRDILANAQKPIDKKPGLDVTQQPIVEVPKADLPLLPSASLWPEEGTPPLSLPSPDVLATEAELLMQLSRAASQGMVTLAGPDSKIWPHAPRASLPDDAANPKEKVAFHAETSMDRDAHTNPMARELTTQGETCLSDEALALADWGSDEPAPLQLTRARNRLTGEFDRPDPAAVRSLAQLYLHLGMGAEARQTLRAFNDQSEDAALLAALGQIIDDQTPATDTPLSGMQGCNTHAALWAFLVSPTDTAGSANAASIVRTFSGLPAPLRATLGQRLSDRFIREGNPGSARDIRNAMARAEGAADHRNLGMVDANLALEAQDPALALEQLDRLASGNDDLAIKAAMTAMRTRLDQQEEITANQVEAIAALAFEHGGGALGANLVALEIEARAAAGDYDGAARRLEERQTNDPDTDLRPLARMVMMRLAAQGDDAAFLRLYFHKPATLDAALNDPAAGSDTLQTIAARLAKLGFPAETRALLAGPAGQTDTGRAILARAALAEFAPDKALAQLDGLSHADASGLRAEALLMQKDYASAAIQLARSGPNEDLARALWQSGDWQDAAAHDDSYRAAADKLGLTDAASPAAPDARPVEATASLAASKAVVSESGALRAAIVGLLALPVATGN